MFRKPLQQTLKADHTSRVSRCAVCLRRWVIEVLKPFMSNNERAPNNWGVALPAPPPPPHNLPDYESSRIPPSFFGVEMGRPPNVTKQEAIALIGKYMEHFRTNKFPEYSSAVWRSMSQDTDGRWKPRSVYNHVRENKRGDLVEARQNLGIMISAPGKNIDIIDNFESVIDKSCVNESGSDDQSVYQDDDHDEDGSEWFDLKLTRVEWEEIKPDNTCVRTRKALKPHVWGNVIAKAFWRRYNFPCAFVFKWSYVSQQSDDKENESYFLKIKGSCTSKKCKNTFLGIADKDPGTGDLHLRIRTRDTRQEYHERVKRPLKSKERKIVGEQLKTQSATVFRRKLAKDNMSFGDNEPYFLQSNQVNRQAKMEYINEELGIKHQDRRDNIKSIENMSTEIRYVNVIREVGSNPFHVFYCTPAQLHVYQEYCRVTKNKSQICIDATGSLVKKFETRLNRKSSHIFLYSITINFEQTTLAVNQMLSEKHNTEFIEYWLKSWLRMGASPPNEAHCDYSRALLLALCGAFNQQTIKDYVDSLFLSATKEDKKCDQWRPSTFLRVDVAHVMHFCVKWECIKNQKHPYLKSFYLRTIALMIDCQSVEEFKRIMLLTCIVALQPYENTIIILPEFQLSVKEARQTFEKFISVRGPIIQELETSATSCKKKHQDSIEMIEPSDTNLTTTHRWIKTLINMVKPKNLKEETGIEINGFYLPNFVDQIERIAKEFPLWTAAIVPNKKKHASTAYMEGYFADLKDKVFKDFPKPITVNRFLRVHVDDLIGAANLFAPILKHFNMQRLPVPVPTDSSFKTEEHHNKSNLTNSNVESAPSFQIQKVYNKINDSDLRSRELWRGLVNENNILFENDQETLVKQRNEETLSDQSKIIVDSSHNENIHQIDNSDLKRSKSEYADGDCIHGGFTNYQQLSDKQHDSKFEAKTEDLQNPTFVSKLLNFESKDILELIDNNLFLDNKRSTQGDQSLSFDNISSPVSMIPAFSSTPLLDHSYANIINPNEQELLIKENNKTDPDKDKKKDKKNTIINNNSGKPQAPPSYYFKPYPEIKVINQMKVPQKKGFLLPNGLISKPVKFEGKTIFVQNTCGIDAISQVLHFGALDDPVYCSTIQSSTNETLQLVNAFMKRGPAKDIFLRQFLILRKFYPIVQRTEATTSLNPYFLNAENNIGTIWKEIFDSEPSLFKTYECNNPTCNFEPQAIPFLSVNHRTIGRKGFGALEEAIQFHSRISNIKCRKEECKGIATEINMTNSHIFIELDIRPQTQMTAGMQCTLCDFPIVLHLEKKYRLAGVIGYTPGHFVAYCRRITGRWLLCNNLKTTIESCNDKTVIIPHGVIYILI